MTHRIRPFPLFAAVAAVLAALSLPAAAGEKPAPSALDRARAAMLARDAKTAVQALEAHLKGRPADAHEASLLLARAHILAGDKDKALAALERPAAAAPGDPWRNKALFLKADLLVELGRGEEALKIYEEQAKAFTSEERRLRMAETYLKFADEFFAPADEVKKPDYGRADLFYAKAMEMGLPAAREAEVVLKRAKALSELRRHKNALALLAAWRKAHEDHARDLDLALAEGEANLALGRADEARRLFRDILKGAPPAEIAIQALFGVARSHGLPAPRSALDLELGIQPLRDVVARFPDHEKAAEAAFQIGAAYMNQHRLDEACRELAAFLASPLAKPGVEQVPVAKQMLGLAHLRRREYDDAIRVWRGFLADHPAHGLWTQVQRQVMDAEYAVGADQYDAKAYDKARASWDRFLEAHPLDGRCRGILLLYGKADHERKRFDAAVSQWEKLVSKYPGTNEASEGLFLIGRTFEADLGKFLEALAAYRKLDFGPFAGQARERVEALERKELRLRTERIFRTDETPSVKVSVRNIKSLEFRAWSVDLEAYFRKMHTAQGVEALDVPLIEPDHSWTVEVPSFEAYREIERPVDLPFKGPGVWAVNVTGEDLEATTVVVRSDIALVIKASRANLLVFGQNVRTGKPQGGVKVVVSDGSKILLEGETDAQGVVFAEPEGLAGCDAVRVLGAHGGSWASNTLSIRGLPAAVGLARKAFLFTDRPAYRPGDTVHLKGVIREVDKGEYVFAKGAAYTIQVFSARSQLVRKAETALTSFGTLDGSFDVPANAPLGDWRILVTNAKGEPFSTTFRVVEYRVPKLRLKVEVERDVCYRGETVQGKIVLTTFYGEPAPHRAVEIGFGHLPSQSAVTDEKGEAPFRFETAEFRETQTVALWGHAPAEDVRGAVNVHLSTTEYTLALKTLRDVYLSDEPFDLEAKATDIAGKPVSVPLEIGLYRLEDASGTISEVPVQTLPLTTDAKTGARKATLSLTKGGRHRIRARGKDRFGNTITAETELFVSGKEDEVKVRILSDREEYRLGEAPMIDVHSRLEARPVLFTFEGERVFRYRVGRLLPGTNAVQVKMDAHLAPNFILSATVLDGADLHEARREFRVTRRLDVTVRALDAQLVPGGTARVEIVTRDPLGNPVPAEVALAMVDRAYLSLFPRDDADPADTFFTRRQPGCGTVSTNVFSFDAETRKVLEALREEEQRVEQNERRSEELKKLLDRVEHAKNKSMDAPEEAEWADAEKADALPASEKELQVGGGAGGTYGGRFGGRRNLRARGGYAAEPGNEDFRAEFSSAMPRGDLAKGMLAQRAVRLVFSLMEEVRAAALETGYWNPRVETGKDGRAVVEVTLPANVTTWEFYAAGVTESLLVGVGAGECTTRKELVVELKSPMALTEGDVAQVRASARNLTGEARTVALALLWAEGEEGRPVGRTEIEVPAGGEGEAVFELSAGAPGDRVLLLAASCAGVRDETRERLRVLPKGTEIRAGLGGAASRDHRARLQIPERDWAWKAMTVSVGASLNRTLLEIGEAPPRVFWGCEPASVFSSADRGLLALAKRAFLKSTGRAAEGEWARFDAAVQAAVSEIALQQDRDGGFSWTPGGGSNVFATAQAVRFLSRARAEGFSFDGNLLPRAGAYLQKAFAGTEDNTVKAAALWALAHLDMAEFSYVNRLHRIRESLPPWAQAALANTLLRMDRREMAAAVARLLEARILVEPPVPAVDEKRGSWVNRWADSDRAEELALSLLALCQALPESGRLAEGVNRLMELRVGSVWPTGKATAAAAEALALYLTRVKTAGDRYRVVVEVNGKLLAALDMDGAAGTRTLDVPAEALRPGANEIQFKMDGVGTYSWRADFLGLTREPDDSQKNRHVRIERVVQPQSLAVNGKDVPPGFSCADTDEEDRWVNLLSTLPEGRSGTVEIRYASREGEGYLVLEESLPGGVVVQPESIQGDFGHFEIQPGRILFFLREGASAGKIGYRFYGYLPGRFAHAAPRVWSAVEPSRLSTGAAGSLTVLPAGQPSTDATRPTPDELLALGRARFAEKDFRGALEALTPLFDGFRLKASAFADTAAMLLFSAVELDRPNEIVKYFEILKERLGGIEIPFDKTLVIAKAYRTLGEEELALQIYQGLLEASFLRESNVAGDLEDQGRFLDSVAFLENLVREYPDLPVVVGGRFALTQSVYDHAEGRAEGLGRAELIARAASMLRAFLAEHPDHRLSDAAGFSLANAYLALKAGKAAGDLAETLVALHAKSSMLDEFHYLAALAFFRAHEWERALEHASQVASGRFLRPDGSRAESPKKHLAVYILGQIHHARGDFGKAEEYYKQVSDRFSDARAALEQFRWQRLFLPEVTLFKPGDAIEVKVTHRNVETLGVLVYPVDLMKLYLIRKNLDDVASVNLAGIKPFHAEQRPELGKKPEFRDRETIVKLPVEKEGAYLVVAKGDGVEASGLVVLSALKLEVQEDLVSGRLRVTVRNEGSGLFEEDAHVKVAGSESDEFLSGDTDLRGVFEAGGLVGQATVIVKKHTSYAFYRGDAPHRPAEAMRRRAARGEGLFAAPTASPSPAAQILTLGQQAETQELLEDALESGNRALQKRNVEDLKALTRSKQQGMQAQQAKRK